MHNFTASISDKRETSIMPYIYIKLSMIVHRYTYIMIFRHLENVVM